VHTTYDVVRHVPMGGVVAMETRCLRLVF